MDFLWDELSWLFPRFWLVGYPSLVIKFLNFQNLVGVSRISLAPPGKLGVRSLCGDDLPNFAQVEIIGLDCICPGRSVRWENCAPSVSRDS